MQFSYVIVYLTDLQIFASLSGRRCPQNMYVSRFDLRLFLSEFFLLALQDTNSNPLCKSCFTFNFVAIYIQLTFRDRYMACKSDVRLALRPQGTQQVHIPLICAYRKPIRSASRAIKPKNISVPTHLSFIPPRRLAEWDTNAKQQLRTRARGIGTRKVPR